MIIEDCKNCITYAICRSDLINSITKSLNRQETDFDIIGAYAYILVGKCKAHKNALHNSISYFQEKDNTHDQIIDHIEELIIQVFKLSYLFNKDSN